MDILETHAYDRRQRRNTTFILFLTLIPFFLATAAYFYLWPPDSSPSVMAAGVTSAPVVLLALTVLSWSGAQSVLGVAGGLVFSAAGDCCLIWPELLLPGMAAFAVAHLLYSLAFRSARYSTYSSLSSACSRFIYVVLFVLGGGVYVYLFPFLQKLPDPGVLAPAVGVYMCLLVLMGGSAIQTRRAATLLGAVSFGVSDLMLSLKLFNVMEQVEHGYAINMVAYYLAQLLIAVGDIQAVENKDDLGKWKRS